LQANKLDALVTATLSAYWIGVTQCKSDPEREREMKTKTKKYESKRKTYVCIYVFY